MKRFPMLRRAALLVFVALVAAGCTTPPTENRPGDLHCDADQDGIPDGDSPDPWANETCPAGEGAGNETPDAGGAADEGQMPGVLP